MPKAKRPDKEAVSRAIKLARTLRQTQHQMATHAHEAALDDLTSALDRLDSTLTMTLATTDDQQPTRISGDLAQAEQVFHGLVGPSPDVVFRRFWIGTRRPGLLVFVDGLVDNEMIDQDIVQRLEDASDISQTSPKQLGALAYDRLITVGHVTTTSSWPSVVSKVMTGNTAVFVQGLPRAFVVDTVKYPARTVPSTKIEPAIKGPQEAFNEVGLTHMNQLRRWLRSPRLHFDSHTVGKISQTPVYVAYLDGVVNRELLSRITDRVDRIERDVVTRANDVAEYLSDRRLAVFPQFRLSDRVDWVARELGQGKVAILVENDPFAILMPMTLVDFYKTSQDYSFSTWDSTLIRLIRLAGLLAGLYLMPLYIALTSVNVDLMPTPLLLTIDGSRQGIPFPPVVEVMIMYLIIEILREAANRLPQQLGVTLGTVGAVVVGTAIVKAGIVDDVMIVSATLTALGLFTTPAFEMTTPWRWLFWVMILGAYLLGIFGILLVTVGIVAYLAGMESFGTPYLTPFGPLQMSGWADSIMRWPIPLLQRRPEDLRPVHRRKAEPVPTPKPFRLGPRNSKGSTKS